MSAVQWSIDWRGLIPDAKVLGTPGYLSGISHDSRQVRQGHAFVAVRGAQQDGHDYLESALKNGAALLVVQRDCAARWRPMASRVPLVVVEDTRAVLGPISSAVFDHPSRRLALVGVTGTDGKTTTTQLTAHVLSACGLDAGYLSTNGFRTANGEEKNESHMTTVEAPLLQSRLRDAVLNGKRAMALEASSEGLAQHRLDGCEFDVAVFTNLTRDHLDFHGTMAAYLEAKGRLFQMLDGPRTKPGSAVAVLNRDDPASETLAEMTRAGVIWYGLHEDADLSARDIRVEGFDTSFTLDGAGSCATVRSRMPGRFNVYNCLAAIAAAKALGIDACDAAASIESFPGILGRMERIDRGQPFDLVLDSASTPASLMTVLEMIRPLVKRRLIVVIGAPGGRDRARRSGLARASGRFADLTVLTSDDPRHEDPEAILEDMAEGLHAVGQKEGVDFMRVLDRSEAISLAVERARPGDTVVLAGKPNETTMLVGDQELPWDERQAALDALSAAGVR